MKTITKKFLEASREKGVYVGWEDKYHVILFKCDNKRYENQAYEFIIDHPDVELDLCQSKNINVFWPLDYSSRYFTYELAPLFAVHQRQLTFEQKLTRTYWQEIVSWFDVHNMCYPDLPHAVWFMFDVQPVSRYDYAHAGEFEEKFPYEKFFFEFNKARLLYFPHPSFPTQHTIRKQLGL